MTTPTGKTLLALADNAIRADNEWRDALAKAFAGRGGRMRAYDIDRSGHPEGCRALETVRKDAMAAWHDAAQRHLASEIAAIRATHHAER